MVLQHFTVSANIRSPLIKYTVSRSYLFHLRVYNQLQLVPYFMVYL